MVAVFEKPVCKVIQAGFFLSLRINLVVLLIFNIVHKVWSEEIDFKVLNFAKSDTWIRSQFYQSNDTHTKSLISTSSFYVSKNGFESPLQELEESILRMKSEFFSENEYCKHIRKYNIIRKNLFPSDSKKKCTDFENWKKKLNVHSVYLVFAGSYPQNPASLFGHLYLRFENPELKSAELNYAVNFAAQTGSESGALFALKGLFGGYLGGLTMIPVHVLHRDYGDIEGRTQWEVDLEFSEDQIEDILMLIYEFDNNLISYLFLKKNCASFIDYIIKDVKNIKYSKIDHEYWSVPSDIFLKWTHSLPDSKPIKWYALAEHLDKKIQYLSENEKENIKQAIKNKTFHNLQTNELDTLILYNDVNSKLLSEDEKYELLKIRSTRMGEYESFLPHETLHDLRENLSTMLGIGRIDNKAYMEINLFESKYYKSEFQTRNWNDLTIGNLQFDENNNVRMTFFNFLAAKKSDFLKTHLAFGSTLEWYQIGGEGLEKIGINFDQQNITEKQYLNVALKAGVLSWQSNILFTLGPRFTLLAKNMKTKIIGEVQIPFKWSQISSIFIINNEQKKLQSTYKFNLNWAIEANAIEEVETLRRALSLSGRYFF